MKNEIHIDTYTYENNHVSEVKLHEYRNHFYLYNLYTEKDYRNLGITSYVSELIDYLVKDTKMTCILGFFNPFEFSKDRTKPIYNKEQKELAEIYYAKNGYQIVNYKTFLKNRNAYKELYPCNFNKGRQSLIYKKIQKQDIKYEKIGDIIVHKNALDELNQITTLPDIKILKIRK